MQVVHELGHVLLAHLTGAEVIKVVLHPLTLSRTDIGENPHPLAVVWGGPVVGVSVPLLLFGLAAACRLPGLYLFRFFAGFCLVANGIYIGAGWVVDKGADPWMMRIHGSPAWLLVLFGMVCLPLGLYLWHRQGPHFGLGEAKGRVDWRAATVSLGLVALLVAVELVYAPRQR